MEIRPNRDGGLNQGPRRGKRGGKTKSEERSDQIGDAERRMRLRGGASLACRASEEVDGLLIEQAGCSVSVVVETVGL